MNLQTVSSLDRLLPSAAEQMQQFCQRWQITELAIFGSILREDFGPDSDVDVMVTFAPEASWSVFDHVQMQEELSELLGREVDLITRRAVEQSSNWMRRKSILDSAEILYSTNLTNGS
jgi:predicted nucleotidyltransferase